MTNMTIIKPEQRILKFRAWSTKLNKFLATGFHIIGECTLFDMLNSHTLEELDTLIIQQWTGSEDKNGKDVYEGDIIKYISPTDEEVIRRNSSECQNKVIVRWSDEYPGFIISDLWCQDGEYEIIGNIFEK